MPPPKTSTYKPIRLIELILLISMIIIFMVFVGRPYPKDSPYYSQYYDTSLVAVTYITLGGLTLVCVIDLACQFSGEPISPKPMCLFCMMGFALLLTVGIMSINQYQDKIYMKHSNSTHRLRRNASVLFFQEERLELDKHNTMNSTVASPPNYSSQQSYGTNSTSRHVEWSIDDGTMVNVDPKDKGRRLSRNASHDSESSVLDSTRKQDVSTRKHDILDGGTPDKDGVKEEDSQSVISETNASKNANASATKKPGLLLFLGIVSILTSLLYLFDAVVYIRKMAPALVEWHSRVYPQNDALKRESSHGSTGVTGDVGIHRKITEVKLHQIETLYTNRESKPDACGSFADGAMRAYSFDNRAALAAMSGQQNLFYATSSPRYYMDNVVEDLQGDGGYRSVRIAPEGQWLKHKEDYCRGETSEFDEIESICIPPDYDKDLIADGKGKRPNARRKPFQFLREEPAKGQDANSPTGNILNETFVRDFGKQFNVTQVYPVQEMGGPAYATSQGFPSSSSGSAFSTMSAKEKKRMKKAQKKALKAEKKARKAEQKALKKARKGKGRKKSKKGGKSTQAIGDGVVVQPDGTLTLTDGSPLPPPEVGVKPRVCCGSKWRRKSRRHIKVKPKKSKVKQMDDDVYRLAPAALPVAQEPYEVETIATRLPSQEMTALPVRIASQEVQDLVRQFPTDGYCHCKEPRIGDRYTSKTQHHVQIGEPAYTTVVDPNSGALLQDKMCCMCSRKIRRLREREAMLDPEETKKRCFPRKSTSKTRTILSPETYVEQQRPMLYPQDSLMVAPRSTENIQTVYSRPDSSTRVVSIASPQQFSPHHADCICDTCMCVDTHRATLVSPQNLLTSAYSRPASQTRLPSAQQSWERTQAGSTAHHADCICDVCLCIDAYQPTPVSTVYTRQDSQARVGTPLRSQDHLGHPDNCPCVQCRCDTDDLIVAPSATRMMSSPQYAFTDVGNQMSRHGSPEMRDIGIMVDTCRCCDCVKPAKIEQMIVQERIEPVKINIVKEREQYCYCKIVIKPTPSVPRVEVARITVNKGARKSVDVQAIPLKVAVPAVRRTIWESRTVTRTAVKSECGLARVDTSLLNSMELRCACGRKGRQQVERIEQVQQSGWRNKPCHCCTCNDEDRQMMRSASAKASRSELRLGGSCNVTTGSGTVAGARSPRGNAMSSSAQLNTIRSSRSNHAAWSHEGGNRSGSRTQLVRNVSSPTSYRAPSAMQQHHGSSMNVAFAQGTASVMESDCDPGCPTAPCGSVPSPQQQSLLSVGVLEGSQAVCDTDCPAPCASSASGQHMSVMVDVLEAPQPTTSIIDDECPCGPSEVVQEVMDSEHDNIFESHPVASDVHDYPIVSSSAQLKTTTAKRNTSGSSRRLKRPASTSPTKLRGSKCDGKSAYSSYGGTFHVSKDVAPISSRSCSPPPIPYYHMHDICCQPIPEAPSSQQTSSQGVQCLCPPPVAVCPLGHAHNIGAMAASPRQDGCGGTTRNFFIYPVSVERSGDSATVTSPAAAARAASSEEWVNVPGYMKPRRTWTRRDNDDDGRDEDDFRLRRKRLDGEGDMTERKAPRGRRVTDARKRDDAISIEIDASSLMIPQVAEVKEVETTTQATSWCMAAQTIR